MKSTTITLVIPWDESEEHEDPKLWDWQTVTDHYEWIKVQDSRTWDDAGKDVTPRD
jgi:hypothetical protein